MVLLGMFLGWGLGRGKDILVWQCIGMAMGLGGNGGVG